MKEIDTSIRLWIGIDHGDACKIMLIVNPQRDVAIEMELAKGFKKPFVQYRIVSHVWDELEGVYGRLVRAGNEQDARCLLTYLLTTISNFAHGIHPQCDLEDNVVRKARSLIRNGRSPLFMQDVDATRRSLGALVCLRFYSEFDKDIRIGEIPDLLPRSTLDLVRT